MQNAATAGYLRAGQAATAAPSRKQVRVYIAWHLVFAVGVILVLVLYATDAARAADPIYTGTICECPV